MVRNIVICCDGTNNLFGTENTNVVRLVRSLDRKADEQLVYYDPGVGTFPDPMLWNPISWLKAKTWRLADLMIGWGLESNVTEAYSYLMDYWLPGDKVFLFGFSRGAYTVRVLAGMLHLLGLLPPGNNNLVPYVMDLYKSIRSKSDGKTHYWDTCNAFRKTFARGDGPDRHFPVHFLGVWDTVSSYGWFWDPASFPFTAENPSVSIVRHAVSIDERRAFFRQNLFTKADGQDLSEHWFPGVHSDIGGYPIKDGSLWRPTFEWMINEAIFARLSIDSERFNDELRDSAKNPYLEPMHNSLTPAWWIAEFTPKLQSKYCIRFNLFRRRFVRDGALIDRVALLRLRDDPTYLPTNLGGWFIERAVQLRDIPVALRYCQKAKNGDGISDNSESDIAPDVS